MSKSRDIAVIGMGCLLPGARNVQEFWRNVLQQKDSITDIPESHWNVDDYYDEDPTVPDKSYCRRGGFLPTIQFDPMAYGIAPKDLDVLDSAQLLGMVVARDALEDAGYLSEKNGKSFDRDRCSVILGTTSITELSTPLNMRLAAPTIRKVLDTHGIDSKTRDSILDQYCDSFPIWQENSFPGVLGNVVSGRIASHLNLGGTNCVIDAACASALGAVKMATDALISGSCDMAISGGVDTINNVFMYMCFSKTPAFSAEGMSRPFDKDSDGILIAEGVALTVLKRLEDAIRDGDRIYSVIKAVGSSSDGKSRSVYQPVSTGQSKAIRQAHEIAQILPEDVSLLEAHGTGTRVGDATELQGLHSVFGKPGEGKAWCALGSVKSQIGHAKACAGMAGLLKAALSTYHKVLPGTINIEEPNPKLELEDSAFFLNTQPRPWMVPQGKERIAGISAFGFGGTNFHVILGEQNENIFPRITSPVQEFFPFSAQTPAGLIEDLSQKKERLGNVGDFHSYARYIQHQTDSKLPCRAGIVASGMDELENKIQTLLDHLSNSPELTFSSSKGTYYLPGKEFEEARVGLVFSGQGSQYLGMLRSLYLMDPQTQEILKDLERLRRKEDLPGLDGLIWPPEEFDGDLHEEHVRRLKRTDHAQSALSFAHLALGRFLGSAGVKPDGVAGHSFGELSALHFSSVFDMETYVSLAMERGKLMQEAAQKGNGSMLAVLGDRLRAVELFDQYQAQHSTGVVIANENSPNQMVLSGEAGDLEKLKERFEKDGMGAQFLPVGAAFHSPLMDDAVSCWKSFLEKIRFERSEIPVYSCSVGKPYPESGDEIRSRLSDQLRNPVRFVDQIEEMYGDGIRIFIDVGPSRICSRLISEILGERPHVALECDGGAHPLEISQWNSLSFLTHTLAQLFSMGKLDFKPGVFGDSPLEFPAKPKISPAAIPLNGANYLRKETREAPYAKPRHPLPKNHSKIQPNDLQKASVGVTSSPSPGVAPKHAPSRSREVSNRKEVSPPVNRGGLTRPGDHKKVTGVRMSDKDQAFREMGEFHRYRMKMLEVHEQFLQTQSEANRLYEKMLFGESGHGVDWNENPAPSYRLQTPEAQPVPSPSVEVSRPVIHKVAAMDPVLSPVIPQPMAATPLRQEPPVSVESPPEPGLPTPAEAVNSQQVRNGSLLSSMFEKKPVAETQESPSVSEKTDSGMDETVIGILAEKTGFPAEMLNLEMDLESDLAVDSIRRVEILGAVQEAFPSAPAIAPSDMGVIKTIGDLCNHLQGGAAVESVPTDIPSEIPLVRSEAEVSEKNSVGNGEILKELLNVISEKTGFPLEMLNEDMDLEDDLAVDSIRRVEILGAIREKFPKAPTIDPTQMGVLKTISDLVGHLSQSMDELLGTDAKKKSQMA